MYCFFNDLQAMTQTSAGCSGSIKQDLLVLAETMPHKTFRAMFFAWACMCLSEFQSVFLTEAVLDDEGFAIVQANEAFPRRIGICCADAAFHT